MPAQAAPAPKPAETPKVEARPKVGFRSSMNGVGTRPVEIPSEEKRPAEKRTAEKPVASPARTAATKPAPAETPAPKTRITETHPAKSTPAPIAKVKSPATPAPSATPRTAETRIVVTRSTETRPKPTLAPAITAIPPSKITSIKPQPTTYFSNTPPHSSAPSGRYPWKTNIVTTIFWIGEKPSGNNFTPNHASSWDANWAENYGGFDNPDPAARRNYIPVKFKPRQNPFYVALPYNDVTRGTTKPESRRVIPWFREAFQREGQSVCRDRWIAIRSRSGRVAYAQWSDCGPFRTDHWQYVFGHERPRPNLNKGAGLDVSPAVRDYLGLSSTDVTDWKFVDFKDVPNGPWALHGDNNTFAQRNSRTKSASKGSSRTADNFGPLRIREL